MNSGITPKWVAPGAGRLRALHSHVTTPGRLSGSVIDIESRTRIGSYIKVNRTEMEIVLDIESSIDIKDLKIDFMSTRVRSQAKEGSGSGGVHTRSRAGRRPHNRKRLGASVVSRHPEPTPHLPL
ncbi:hypothetical protein EVAR_11104_1 [Eumeta japonica]|uniref:Uncharacterized protein n=1 Tax=Eumeta variegata TaxID=151549 RepID=A0A4C1U3V7_EUMVA|nr:hypothetical protein EVAR_11104_1 [Eumeta japonica]